MSIYWTEPTPHTSFPANSPDSPFSYDDVGVIETDDFLHTMESEWDSQQSMRSSTSFDSPSSTDGSTANKTTSPTKVKKFFGHSGKSRKVTKNEGPILPEDLDSSNIVRSKAIPLESSPPGRMFEPSKVQDSPYQKTELLVRFGVMA